MSPAEQKARHTAVERLREELLRRLDELDAGWTATLDQRVDVVEAKVDAARSAVVDAAGLALRVKQDVLAEVERATAPLRRGLWGRLRWLLLAR